MLPERSPRQAEVSGLYELGGYLFIALFCAMAYAMFLRSADLSEELSLRATIHVLIAMSLVPLLLLRC